MFNFFKKKQSFHSEIYWESRYKAGGNSGAGSYNHLAAFKAELINALVDEFKIQTAIEFGSGDGNQLSMLKFQSYTGLDVSVSAIELCKNKFEGDSSKSFFLYNNKAFVDNRGVFRCDASMSLDVLYHLVEQEVYEDYLKHLFQCSSKLVIIYGADMSLPQKTPHELYRSFTKDIEKLIPGWQLARHIRNKYPAKNYDDQEGSLADFYLYTPVQA
jgi:hypothetical protein